MTFRRSRRLLIALDTTLDEAAADQPVLAFQFALRDGDVEIEFYSQASTGPFGIRLDGDVADRITLATGTTDSSFSVEGDARGLRTMTIFSRDVNVSLQFIEIYVISNP